MRNLILSAAVGLFISLQGSGAVAETWDDVIAAAKKEGQVVVYNGHAGAKATEENIKAFEAKYGITVNMLEGRGAEMQERVRTEVSTGHMIVDVSFNGSNNTLALASTGALVPFGDLPNLGNVALKNELTEVSTPVFVSATGIAINTDLVPPAEEPKSWLDLLDPKWKGRILSDELAGSGTGATWFGVLHDKFGEDYHRKMAKQDIVFSSTLRENPRRVARGEFALYFPFNVSDLPALKGLPIKGIALQEGAPYTVFSAGVVKGAPHPNAARLFIDFLISEEGQMPWAMTGFPVASGPKGDLVPKDVRWMVDANLLGKRNPKTQEAFQKLAKEIYNR
jgi:iron(III) transport system substrate-binding protein